MTGFLLGSVLMLDRPSRREEELGELFLSISVLLFVLSEYLDVARPHRSEDVCARPSAPRGPAADGS